MEATTQPKPWDSILVRCALASLLLGTASACGSAKHGLAASTPTSGIPARVTTGLTTPPTMTGSPFPTNADGSVAVPAALKPLDGKYLTGTQSAGWSAFQLYQEVNFQAQGAELAKSSDDTYQVAVISFPTTTWASAFFSTPPVPIAGIGGWTGYSMTTPPSEPQSEAFDLVSCGQNGQFVTGHCQGGGPLYEGTAILVQHGNNIIASIHLPANNAALPVTDGNAQAESYATSALTMLQAAGG